MLYLHFNTCHDTAFHSKHVQAGLDLQSNLVRTCRATLAEKNSELGQTFKFSTSPQKVQYN